MTHYALSLLSSFQCLGDRCPDTCCAGWDMQLDQATLARYKEDPQLCDTVEKREDVMVRGEKTSYYIMKKNPETGTCQQLCDGLCSIHKNRGETELGDACALYPRLERQLGDSVVMTTIGSCPEIARLALCTDNAITIEQATLSRIIHGAQPYPIDPLTDSQAIAVINQFLNHATQCDTPERYLLHCVTVARSLESLDIQDWPAATEFLLSTADMRLLPAAIDDMDGYRLLQSLALLLKQAPAYQQLRLAPLLDQLSKSFECTIDPINCDILPQSPRLVTVGMLYETLQAADTEALLSKQLIRWIQLELASMHFPFAGFGDTLFERAVMLGIRFALLKCLLASHVKLHAALPNPSEMMRYVSTLARFLNHLADPMLSRLIYQEAGWFSDTRLRGLIEK